MSDGRALFDAVIAKYPSFKDYLSSTAQIIHSPLFESGIVKILNREINLLSTAEQDAVQCFIKPEKEKQEVPEKTSFAKEVLEKKRKRILENCEDYTCLKFIPCTSNTCERTFSASKYILTPERQRLLPVNFEMILYLKINRSNWDSSMLFSIDH